MKALATAAAFILASCSDGYASEDRYEELLGCEMRVLVVASFVNSLSNAERTLLHEKLESLSKSVLSEAASLKKSTANIAEDQKRILRDVQGRVQGASADTEARKLVNEAKTCK